MEKTAAQVLHEHSPNKDANYETSWIIAAMQEYNAQALNASTVLLNEATKTVSEATLHSSQLKEELKNLEDELRVEVNLKKTFSNAVDNLQEELSALREENERLSKAIPSDEEVVIELIARYSRMSRGLEIARDAFTQAVLWIRGRALHPSHNTEEK